MKLIGTGLEFRTKDLVIVSTKKQEIWLSESDEGLVNIKFITQRK